MMGLTRWFRVCKSNMGKDVENKTKVVQILMMMLLGSISIALTFVVMYADNFWTGVNTLLTIAIAVEYGAGGLVALIGYLMLAKSWEGY